MILLFILEISVQNSNSVQCKVTELKNLYKDFGFLIGVKLKCWVPIKIHLPYESESGITQSADCTCRPFIDYL